MAVVIHDLRCNRRAVLGIEGHGPGLDPLGIERQIAGHRSVCRVVVLSCLIGGPTGQTVSVTGGCGIRNSQFLTVLDEQCHTLQCGRWIVRAFFQVQRHGMVHLAAIGPLGVQRQLAGHRGAEAVRPGAGRIGGPADEHLAVKGWIGRFRHGLPVFHGRRSDGCSFVRVEGHGVRVRRPLGVQRQVAGHRSGVEIVGGATGRIGSPPCERISCAGRIGRSGSLFAVADELRVNRAAAGRIERDLVRHGPLRVQRHRSGDLAVEVVRMDACHVGGPTHELEAILRRRDRLACRAAQLHGLCSNR